jgi:hypothetical protein
MCFGSYNAKEKGKKKEERNMKKEKKKKTKFGSPSKVILIYYSS